MTRTFIFLALAFAAAILVFGLWPEIDLAAAQLFFTEIGFAHGPQSESLRRIAYYVPFILLGLLFILYGARCLGWLPARATPGTRKLAVLALGLALGPGLFVNGLKDHSHRPRPVQTIEFGGKWGFRPFYDFDGACLRNCSFPSGEAASGFWTLAAANLAPPPLRLATLAAAAAFALTTSALRMASGGHYLSDIIFSGLFTWLVIFALQIIFRRRAQAAEADLRHSEPTL